MARPKLIKNTYRSTYQGKISIENTQKHQQFIDDMKKDAAFYYLDHIESSMIPHSMLHKIIQKLKTKKNDRFSLPEKNYLIRQNLNALHNFIEGKISFSQYKKEANNHDRKEYLKNLEADKILQEQLKKEAIERQKQQEKLAQERANKKRIEAEKRKISEREELKKIQELKADLVHKKTSVVTNKTHQNDLNTFENQLLALCQNYFLDMSNSELAITNRSQDILKKYREKQNLRKSEKAYINEYVLRSLNSFLPKFQQKIISIVEVERLAEEKFYQETLKKEAIEKQKRLESDPIYIANQKLKSLLKKYEIDEYLLKTLPEELSEILNKLDNQIRLSEVEAVWLNTADKQFFTSKVRHTFHRLEANYYLQEYQKNTKNIWNAINASSHLRKCQASSESEELLEIIEFKQIKDKKLSSAYFTTLGGVRRDLHKYKVAIENALKAHHVTPENYRPCTLLGAIYMETYQYTLGHEWYEKATKRGATDQSINADLKSILSKMDKVKRNEMIDHLLKLDPHAYSWLKSLKTAVVNNPKTKQNKIERSAKNSKKVS